MSCASRTATVFLRTNGRLIDNPPETSDAFVDAVLRAEGLDPSSLDKHARVALSDVVRDWLFDEGRGKGTRSGLP